MVERLDEEKTAKGWFIVKVQIAYSSGAGPNRKPAVLIYDEFKERMWQGVPNRRVRKAMQWRSGSKPKKMYFWASMSGTVISLEEPAPEQYW